MYLCNDVITYRFLMCDMQEFLVQLSDCQIFKKDCFLEFPLMDVFDAGLLPNLFGVGAYRHCMPFLSLEKSQCLKYEYMYAVIPAL
jgi:hypothetical protein